MFSFFLVSALVVACSAQIGQPEGALCGTLSFPGSDEGASAETYTLTCASGLVCLPRVSSSTDNSGDASAEQTDVGVCFNPNRQTAKLDNKFDLFGENGTLLGMLAALKLAALLCGGILLVAGVVASQFFGDNYRDSYGYNEPVAYASGAADYHGRRRRAEYEAAQKVHQYIESAPYDERK